MKSWWIRTGEQRMLLEQREVPRPEPQPGQLLVRIRAAALNRGEFIAGHGLHAADGPARPAGFEAAGEVMAVGAGVTAFGVGDRVMGRCDGAFAEFGCMAQGEAHPVPTNMPWEQAACTTVVYSTVHDMLIAQGRLLPGEWVLVTGVTSGVGLGAMQVAQALGAKVIGTSGSAEKLSRMRELGLDVGIETRRGDFAPAVLEATGGRGVDLVVNNVGGSMFPACVDSMAFCGRLATVGYIDGVVKADLDLMALHKKRLVLFGVSAKLRTLAHREEAARAFAQDLLPLLAEGRLVPLVDGVFPFDRLPDAQRRMERGEALGKLVLSMD